MPPQQEKEVSDVSSDTGSDLFEEEETKESEDQVPLEQFATDEKFATTLELLQLPPAERSRENVECIFSLVKDNKFFAELDAEMSLELCRHMTYTTKKKDRVVFYKGDPADNWYLILAGNAGVYIEELKDLPEGDGGEQGDSSANLGRAVTEPSKERRVDMNSCVADLGEGHSFGELGLIRNDVRSAALIAHSDCLFLTLDKKSFQHCLGNFLRQKTDDKVQTLRQVLPGARDLRKLVVEQLTYFFKEATLQKDMPLSTEGNKEDTLYLIVKGECVLRTRRRRYVGDFHSLCAGTHEGKLGVDAISQVVSRALRQQREKTAGDSGRLGTAESCSNPFAAASDATKNFFTDTEPMLEQDCEHSGGKAVQQSVLLEELDLALLQEGCIINFCSLFFDSPEPFSVFANSNKTQVFSITKSELFKHMPSSVIDAVRVTGLLLLQHLEARIGKQEDRIRRLELLHQRDAIQNRGDFASADNSSGEEDTSIGSGHSLLPLTFSPFLSHKMTEYIAASSLSLESHFDRFTRNLMCFQPHTAVLNHRTFRLMQQQKQRRMQRHQILLAGDPQYTNTEEEKQNIPTLRPPATTARPDGLPDISPDLSEPPVPVQEPAPTITGKLLSNCRRAGDVSAPGEAIGSNEADELTEAAAAREAAACASSALAHGHPIVSDAVLEYFFRNISRDAVNINNKICCQHLSDVQALFQRAKTHKIGKIDVTFSTRHVRTVPGIQEQHTLLMGQDAFSSKLATNAASSQPKRAYTARSVVEKQSGNTRRTLGEINTTKQVAASQRDAAPGRRRSAFAFRGSKTARDISESLILQQQQHYQQLLAKSTEIPSLHLLLRTPDTYRHKDRSVSLRGMAAAMQLFSSTVQHTSEQSYLQADTFEAPKGASSYTGRRMLAQQVALRLQAQHNEGT